MLLLSNLFGNKKKKQAEKALAQPATRADLDKLRAELMQTPEEKENLKIYNRWQSLTLKERKEKWKNLTIKQRNRLSSIVVEYEKKEVV